MTTPSACSCLRFIPARAGNTRMLGPVTSLPPGSSPLARGTHTRPRCSWLAWAVHPRSRGEHQPQPSQPNPLCGSSPLARGTPLHPLHLAAHDRFIPARAGNTKCKTSNSMPRSVHPRSRGEHRMVCHRPSRVCGSSPLARGTRCRKRAKSALSRFIPARAGNTCWTCCRSTGSTVHPRSRGEHDELLLTDGRWGGSSPLARGTRLSATPSLVIRRFIPARAGNTQPAGNVDLREPVHPRSRGEHHIRSRSRKSASGSSPLARGTPCTSSVRVSRHTVHPRSRGEHRQRNLDALLRDGSSPLARGTLFLRPGLVGRRRFIPARAGNTSVSSMP